MLNVSIEPFCSSVWQPSGFKSRERIVQGREVGKGSEREAGMGKEWEDDKEAGMKTVEVGEWDMELDREGGGEGG